MSGQIATKIAWAPQTGPQKALIDCPFPEIFYGGARGGGKTDGVVGKYAIKAGIYGRGFNGVFFRREIPMLDDAIERSKEIYFKLGAQWQDQKKTWTFPNGARLRFRPLERTQDADKYQGQNVTDACVEEAGQYPDPSPIDRLNGVLRSAHGVPTQLILTGNPGGAGQQWIKARYIDPAPKGFKVLTRNLPNGKTHKFVFIPSNLENNRLLLNADPDYVNRLYLVGSPKLVDAWLKGDWGAIEGAFFDCWSPAHVLYPFEIPAHWMRFRSGDWGSAKPFSFGWWAVASEDYKHGDAWIPRGAMVRYREWYGVQKNKSGQVMPNVGLKMHAELVGRGIKTREKGDDISYGVLDPSAFTEDGGPSIAQRMDVFFRRADNARVAQRGAMGGWDQLRARLEGDHFGEPMGKRPMIYCFTTCTDSIRTIPALQHDPDKAEDLDTNMEDHAADDWRFACMSRPYIKEKPGEASKKRDSYGIDEDDEDNWKTA